ncbi:tRNA pseudouridine(38-40) synthase TruA [Thiovibrio frasassiensis]|uniref:tRNA pseudouridine synthase A n=1 Tax=Thiovibrio frasassiensis TaxID=2984131 RepID=A0A9X4MID5_9BACT|nr:tRNA pseudouridine(38-40) synthase TruA [Thiovibrio frasassiensis]MDG4476440.1 tRNA pseudouridine(38-40) synthase TruA [Thiovibrio frasassiensis]
MRNIKLVLAYDGTGYAGWQRQSGQPSIQQTLEEAIVRLTQGPVLLHGAGRTDAGVHAEGMVANFQTEASIPLLGLVKGLNSMLPEAIRVLSAEKVANDFHARYNATGKVYTYTFMATEIMPPCLRLYAAQVRDPFACDAVRLCLPMLVGTHDFSSFEAVGSRDLSRAGCRGAVRTIFAASLAEQEEAMPVCRLIISGDGFLRHMVRNIVGTLFAVGRGRLTPLDFQEIVAARDRSLAGPTAPAKGLTLKRVLY